jgi:hypothetical protein
MAAYSSLSVIFILAGIGLLGAGIYAFFRQRSRMARGISTTGVVIELVRQRVEGEYVRSRSEHGVKIEGKYRYRPAIRFETPSGESIEFISGIAMRPAPYEVGERVEVIYDPQNPRQAQINRFVNLWFYTLLLLFFGLFTLGMGLLGVFLNR